jgi:hypothetical protein
MPIRGGTSERTRLPTAGPALFPNSWLQRFRSMTLSTARPFPILLPLFEPSGGAAGASAKELLPLARRSSVLDHLVQIVIDVPSEQKRSGIGKVLSFRAQIGSHLRHELLRS